MARLGALLDCEQECMDACGEAGGFDAFNACVEECMFQCSVAREAPAALNRQL